MDYRKRLHIKRCLGCTPLPPPPPSRRSVKHSQPAYILGTWQASSPSAFKPRLPISRGYYLCSCLNYTMYCLQFHRSYTHSCRYVSGLNISSMITISLLSYIVLTPIVSKTKYISYSYCLLALRLSCFYSHHYRSLYSGLLSQLN